MLHKTLLAIASLLPLAAQPVANPNFTVSPLAGSGTRGDGGPATDALIDGPYGLAQDAEGNVYISESNGGVIRRVRTDGTIERFAGTGHLEDGAAGGPALETDLMAPTHLLMDRDGGLLFFDSGSCRIRKVGTDGYVTDVAGTGRCTATGGFGGGVSSAREKPALETLITGMGAMTLDNNGRIVYSETAKNVVRRIDDDGYIRIIAGTGSSGFAGDAEVATAATLNGPVGVAYDASGFLYIADSYNCRIRRVDLDGLIGTILGTTYCAKSNATYVGGSNAAIERAQAMVWDAATNSLFIAIPRVYRVLRFDIDWQRLSPYAGSGTTGVAVNAEPLKLPLNSISAVLPSSRGLLIASNTAFQVYAVQEGLAQAFAGRWPQLDSYPAAGSVEMLDVEGVCALPDGSVLMADAGASRILRWQDPDQVTAVAGMAYPAGLTKGDNGPAVSATVDTPVRMIVRKNGDIFIAEATKIRAINTDGVIRTVKSNLDHPVGMVFDIWDRLIFSESGKNRVVLLDLTTNKTTVLAGTGTAGFDGDGDDATDALLNSPGDLAFDSNSNLLIADRGNQRIRMRTDAGIISTVAGSGLPFSYSDITGQAAIDTGFGSIDGMVVDANDNVYVVESKRVSRIAKDGTMSVVTGFVSEDDSGNVTWMDGKLNSAGAIALDAYGRLFVALRQEGRVLVANPVVAQ